jgi:nucleoside-diphosphate-sugar epimerase
VKTKTQKIAIIGCGWLGLPLAISFLNDSYTVIGTSTTVEKANRLNQLGIEGCCWKFSDGFSKNQLSFLNEVDVLILNVPPSKAGSELTYSNALLKLSTFLPEKSKVIFVSTTSVYPDTIVDASEEYRWIEEDLLKETVQAEVLLTAFLKERLTVLRLAGLIGPNRHPVNSLTSKTNIPNGNSPVNLIHLEDVIGLIKQIISCEFWGEVVNGCYPIDVSRQEYYQKSAAHFNLQQPEFLSSSLQTKRVSSKKSIDLLNYTYKHSIISYSLS